MTAPSVTAARALAFRLALEVRAEWIGRTVRIDAELEAHARLRGCDRVLRG
jgi:butyrate kinase